MIQGDQKNLAWDLGVSFGLCYLTRAVLSPFWSVTAFLESPPRPETKSFRENVKKGRVLLLWNGALVNGLRAAPREALVLSMNEYFQRNVVDWTSEFAMWETFFAGAIAGNITLPMSYYIRFIARKPNETKKDQLKRYQTTPLSSSYRGFWSTAFSQGTYRGIFFAGYYYGLSCLPQASQTFPNTPQTFPNTLQTSQASPWTSQASPRTSQVAPKTSFTQKFAIVSAANLVGLLVIAPMEELRVAYAMADAGTRGRYLEFAVRFLRVRNWGKIARGSLGILRLPRLVVNPFYMAFFQHFKYS